MIYLITIYSSVIQMNSSVIKWINELNKSNKYCDIYYSIINDENELLDNFANTHSNLLIINLENEKLNFDHLLHIKQKNSDLKIIYLTNVINDFTQSSDIYFVNNKTNFNQCLSKLIDDQITNNQLSHVLLVNSTNGKVEAPFHSIMYIELNQKRLVIKLNNNHSIVSNTIRVAMGTYLQDLLLDKRFVRCHSGFIVNIDYIQKINQTNCIMINYDSIPVSKSKSQDLISAYKKYGYTSKSLNNKLNPAVSFSMNNYKQLEYLQKQPFAQCIIRVDVNENGKPNDFVFMYANQQLCILENKSFDEIMGESFYKIFPNADKKWLEYYYDVAYKGNNHRFISYSPEIDKNLDIICYQVDKGYCGCILNQVN